MHINRPGATQRDLMGPMRRDGLLGAGAAMRHRFDGPSARSDFRCLLPGISLSMSMPSAAVRLT